MSRLFLLRHAQAGAGIPDSERALTPLGRVQAEGVGLVLRALRGDRGGITCSPARRCRETAALLGAGDPAVDPRLGLDAPVRGLLELARSARPDAVLVGHQPELQALLAALLPGGAGVPFALPPACLIGLHVADGSALLTTLLEPPEVAALVARPQTQ